MEGDVVLLGLMDWNAAGSTATQFIPFPTTTEVCYELLTGGVRIDRRNKEQRLEQNRSLGLTQKFLVDLDVLFSSFLFQGTNTSRWL